MTQSEIIYVKSNLQMKTSMEGGRKTGFVSGYRPNHVFEYQTNEPLRTFIGDIQFVGQELIMPGQQKVVTVRFLNVPELHKYLAPGRIWWIHEGSTSIGELEVLKISLSIDSL